MSELATIAEMRHPGHTIRERRTQLGWTQAELAQRSDVAQADISRIENGRLDARWSTIQRISEALESSTSAPTRSLANAHRGRRAPRSTGSKTWEPKGPISSIAATDS
jgi:transcriptional regulator with XRE-family HTH domain